MAVDMNKLNTFIGQFVGDLGAAVHTGMVVIGEKLGLYKALAVRANDLSGIGRRDRNGRALRTGMAGFAGSRRLCDLRREDKKIQPH